VILNSFCNRGLTNQDRPAEVEYIINGFLAKEVITLYFAPPKNGKSVLAFSLAKYVHENTTMRVQYFDFDNGVVALEDRGIFESLQDLKRFDYVHPEKVIIEGKDILTELLKFTENGHKKFKNYFLIFDSTTDFTDVESSRSVKRFMLNLKKLRNAGATILLLHHMNKSEKGYEGSQVLISASDNIFKHSMVSETEKLSLFTQKKEYGRFKGVCDVGFSVSRGSYLLRLIPYETAVIDSDDQIVIDKALGVLKKGDGIGQTSLLVAMKYNKADKRIIGILNKYLDRFWRIEKGLKNAKLYYKL